MKKIDAVAIISILIGTVLEWYDFSLLGLMTPIMATLFFPSKISMLSLLASLSIFASGFLVRPLGGIIFGHIGDRNGRRTALSKTIIMMALPTTLIGLLPTFYTIGIAAPVVLVLLRLIQGIASSGEYPGAICFLTEIAPAKKRGLWGSISVLGVIGGMFLGSIINTILSYCLSTKQMYSWGWRIPFLISLPLGGVGWYVRNKVQETDIFQSVKLAGETFKTPFSQLLKFNFASLSKVIVLFALSNISFYMSFVYISTYLISTHKINLHQALLSNTISMAVLSLCVPAFGYISDKVNRKYIMLIGAAFLLALFYPIFTLLLTGNSFSFFTGQILSAVLIAIFAGPMAAISAENFSTSVRYSGISVGLNIGAGVFGGTCPIIATYLVYYSGNEAMPCIYPIVFAFLCLLIIYTLKSNHQTLLNDTNSQNQGFDA